jgi:hypothetical protein
LRRADTRLEVAEQLGIANGKRGGWFALSANFCQTCGRCFSFRHSLYNKSSIDFGNYGHDAKFCRREKFFAHFSIFWRDVLGAETDADHSSGKGAETGKFFKQTHGQRRRDGLGGVENDFEQVLVKKYLEVLGQTRGPLAARLD